MIRIKDLRTENGLTLRDLAKQLELSYSSLSKYEREDQQPNIETLIKLADFFNVTVDYLIGYSDIRTKDIEIRTISEKTGLTPHSIEWLILQKQNSMREPIEKIDTAPQMTKLYLDTLNRLLFPSNELLWNITNYLYFSATHFKKFSDKTLDSLSPISDLELWDDCAKISYSEDWDLWSKALLLEVEENLISWRNNIQSRKFDDSSEE